MDHPAVSQLDAAQANALAAVVELESGWENIPVAGGGSPGESLRGLTAKQRAFDTYRDGLMAYNRQFQPAYHGERASLSHPEGYSDRPNLPSNFGLGRPPFPMAAVA